MVNTPSSVEKSGADKTTSQDGAELDVPLHSTRWVEGTAGTANLPASQAVQAVAPAALATVPTGQPVHEDDAALEYVPGGQSWQVVF